MVDVSQDQITRKWGFRIIEGEAGTMEASNVGINRVLCEEFAFNSPQEVFEYVNSLQKAMSANYFKVIRDGIICGYQIFDTKSRQILYEDSGWMAQSEVNEHLEKMKSCIQGDIKMMAIPKSTKISISGGDKSDGVRSTYTDPVTGKTYDSGEQNVPINLDKVREEAKKDMEADL